MCTRGVAEGRMEEQATAQLSDSLDLHIGRLRKTLIAAGGDDPIQTVHSIGHAIKLQQFGARRNRPKGKTSRMTGSTS